MDVAVLNRGYLVRRRSLSRSRARKFLCLYHQYKSSKTRMEIAALLTILKETPSGVVAGLAVLAIVAAGVIRWREVDVAGVTSIGKLQQEHLLVLMNQNKQLADDLDELRTKMSDTFALMENMRNRIIELEDLVREYKRKCDNCPGPVTKNWGI